MVPIGHLTVLFMISQSHLEELVVHLVVNRHSFGIF